jgi:hypothetical protein
VRSSHSRIISLFERAAYCSWSVDAARMEASTQGAASKTRDALRLIGLTHARLVCRGVLFPARCQLKCAFVALTGRGVVSIIQAIGGVIFSIEGFWGAVKYDAATMKRFLIFLVCYFLVSIAIAIINLETLVDYCSTAISDEDEMSCHATAKLYSYLLLGVTLGLVVRDSRTATQLNSEPTQTRIDGGRDSLSGSMVECIAAVCVWYSFVLPCSSSVSSVLLLSCR